MRLDNKGIAGDRLIASLVALFTLTVIFIGFDGAITHDIYEDMKDLAPDREGNLDMYLNAWHWWVPLFLIAIFLYMFTAGRTSDAPSRYY